ncbi:MAG TPA: serpin family protein [Balneolaceae bacterium]|nr:serpin family protein [Balneolaceae bacterium]
MISSKIKVILVIFLTVSFAACADNLTNPGSDTPLEPRELTVAEKQLVEADQAFSYDIFKRTVESEEGENVFISPLSISFALGMALNGAEGETFDAMQNVLNFSDMNLDDINEGYRSLIELLSEIDPEVQFKIANSIWAREGFQVNEDFIDRLETYFDASFSELDFNDPAAKDIINQWVNENTNGLIEKILDGQISEKTVMFLINALFFDGDWMTQFDPEETQKAEFQVETGETTEVDMMEQEGSFAALFSDEVTMIELPYGDSLFSMTVLMPADNTMPVDDFVSDHITAENLDKWRDELQVEEVLLQLPKFDLEYEITFNEILKSMGMEIAFDPSQADFTGIADVRELFISEVKHKAFVSVDEAGTEAAAVTSVAVPSSLPSSVTVDRPFVFIIHERTSGVNLFMGKVKNPNS